MTEDTTKRILLAEFRRGNEIVKNVEARQGSPSRTCKEDWLVMVLETYNIFDHYKSFLCLEIVAETDEVYQRFLGWVSSKLRHFTKQLEAISGMLIHPNPEQYDLQGSDADWPFGCGMFIAFRFTKEQGAYAGQTIDFRPAVYEFAAVVNAWPEHELYHGQFKLRVKSIIAGAQPPAYALKAETEKRSLKRKARSPSAEDPAVSRAANDAERSR